MDKQNISSDYVEPCSCPMAGFCPRHAGTRFEKKNEQLFKLCQERDDYRAMWDKEWEEKGNKNFIEEVKNTPEYKIFQSGKSLLILRDKNELILEHSNLDMYELFYNQEEQFNNSIIQFDGKTLIAWRYSGTKSEIFLGELLGKDVKFIKKLKVPTTEFNDFGKADPKFFIFKNELYIIYAPISRVDGHLVANQAYFKLDEDFNVVDHWDLKYKKRTYWEKNWGMFENDGKLYCLYSIEPHQVLEVEGDRCTLVHTQYSGIDSHFQTFRGGACPVLHNGEYYHFYHGKSSIDDNHLYSIQLYTFEAKPPFKPLRYIREPLLLPNMIDNPIEKKLDCVFPAGAYHDGKDWVVSYGYYDYWCNLLKFSGEEIEKRLKPIPELAEGKYNEEDRVGVYKRKGPAKEILVEEIEDVDTGSKGLGDTIEKGLNLLGITKERYAAVKEIVTGKKADKKACTPCSRRQAALNKMFPYKESEKAKKKREKKEAAQLVAEPPLN